MKPVEALPKEGIQYLNDSTDYWVQVGYHEKTGWVDIQCPDRTFSCLVSDLPYVLLCDNKKIDELREEVKYLEERIKMMKELLNMLHD